MTMMLSTARSAARIGATQSSRVGGGRTISTMMLGRAKNGRHLAFCRPQARILSLSTQHAWQSTQSAAASMDTPLPTESPPSTAPKLVEIPALPLVGSLISSYSNTPPMEETKVFETWPTLRERFGDFYSIGIPGLGDGWKGTMYVIQDPKEMMKILRREGIYPTSIVQKQWAMVRFLQTANFGRVAHILDQGPEWRRVRSFLQTDLLAPQSASRYLPGIIRAAEYASKGAPHHHANDSSLKTFLNECSFDMFSMILLGDLPRIADPSTPSKPEDERFCETVASALQTNNKLNQDVKSMLMNQVGMQSNLYKGFAASWQEAVEIARTKIDAVLAKRKEGKLSEEEAASYLNQAMERQAREEESNDDAITVEEVKSIATALLTASVDTTSGMMAWHLLHLAQNPNVQEAIYQELMEATNGTGKLTPDAISPQSVPLLHAAIRESHRLTSPSPLNAFRIMPGDVDVHGVTLPKNSMVVCDAYSKGRDADLLDNVDEFRPERFLPEAVEARKGTPSEVIDQIPSFQVPFLKALVVVLDLEFREMKS